MTIEKFKISSLNGDRKMFDALTYQEMLKEIKRILKNMALQMMWLQF